MLRARQRLGKYRIEKRIAEGGFAVVYRAYDTVEGIAVALKVPHRALVTPETLADFRREARLTARLDHPNIVPIKNAGFIENRFVIASPLGERTLGDRLQTRLDPRAALGFAEQLLEGLAHAHERGIIHCDVKPENLAIFDSTRLRLLDFGIAKVALKTIHASGSGTVGYVAPEQAMGRPTPRSDVFSAGLVIYRMLSGELPEWPYTWPPAGHLRLRRRVHRNMIEFLRRAICVDPRGRFEDAAAMLRAFRRVRPHALTPRRPRVQRREGGRDWQRIFRQQFMRRFGRSLQARGHCSHCHGPVSEPMEHCPWCGAERRTQRGTMRFPARCPRCRRGLKRDWRFCPWCYGPAVQEPSEREYSDARYEGRCSGPKCSRRQLMPFMRYCPWCRTKVRREWRVPDSSDRCGSCGWGVVKEFWSHCPWCGVRLGRR